MNSDGYDFTQDWFHWAPPVWSQIFKEKLDNVLEIGAFEGRASVWIIENLLAKDGTLTCIDTWEGGAEHVNGELTGAEERFRRNVELAARRHNEDAWVDTKKGKSLFELADMIHYGMNETQDFIYIDGSHMARDVLSDACLAWPLLKSGGILCFDDYVWGPPGDLLFRPKLAVDSFVNIFADKLELVHAGYQFIVRKK